MARKTKTTSKTGGRKALAKVREGQILEKRIAGKSFPTIAKEMKMSLAGVASAFTRAMATNQIKTLQTATEGRALWSQRLDDWLTRLRPAIEEGDVAAINTALRICERHCKLNGFDFQVDDKQDQQQQLIIFMKTVSALGDTLARKRVVAGSDSRKLGDGSVIDAEFEEGKKK